jgi:hypothetical protein
MQKAHLLSQPTWTVTHAAKGSSRLAGRGGGGFEDLHHRALLPGPLQQGGGAADVVGAEDGVDPGRPLEDLVPVLLRQAATDGDLQAGPLLFQGPQLAEVAVKPVVGVFPYAAGVEDHDVCVLGALSSDHPFGLKKAGQALGVVLVHLAAKCAYEIAAGLARRRRPFPVRPWVFPVRCGHP